jgi:hypothetical protein
VRERIEQRVENRDMAIKWSRSGKRSFLGVCATRKQFLKKWARGKRPGRERALMAGFRLFWGFRARGSTGKEAGGRVLSELIRGKRA